MNIAAIAAAYHVFTRGSEGFCNFICERGGLGISRAEIGRIAYHAPHPEDFARIYEGEEYWLDQFHDLAAE